MFPWSALTTAIVGLVTLFISLTCALVRMWGLVGEHTHEIEELKAGQARQDNDLREMKALLTSTREFLIQRFAKVFAKLNIPE